MKGKRYLLACGLVMASYRAFAVDLHWCDGCSAEDKKNKVTQLTADMGTFDFYIGDLADRSIHKYQLARGYAQPPCRGPGCNQQQKTRVLTYVYDKDVEPEIADAYGKLIAFHDSAPVGWKKLYEIQIVDVSNPMSPGYKAFFDNGKLLSPKIPTFFHGLINLTPVMDYPDPNINVYDVINDGPKQNNFLNHIMNTTTQRLNANMTYLDKILSTFRIIDSTRIPDVAVQVRFSDGGKITALLDTSTTVAKYKIDPESARDSHNNTVPVEHKQLQRGIIQFDFRGPGAAYDQPNMGSQLHRFHVDMSQIPPGRTHYSCSALGNSVTCTIY